MQERGWGPIARRRTPGPRPVRAWLARLSTRSHRSRKRELALREEHVASAGAFHAPGGGATSRGCRPSAGASAGPREPGRLDERGQPATDPRPRKLLRLISRSWRGCRCRPARSGGRLRRRRDSGCGARRAGHTPRATGRRAGLDRCAEDANIARGLAGDDGARSGAQASAQSRLRRMQRTNSCTSSSPRQESAQPVQVAAQSTHSSMLRTSLSRSGPGRCGCALDHLLNRHFDPLLARAWPR
jgi:hypothetical protein